MKLRLTHLKILTVLSLIGLSQCFAQEKSVLQKITARNFPSIFQAWNPAENTGDKTPVETEARHDLIFHAPDYFGLQWDHNTHQGLATQFNKETIQNGKSRRAEILKINPNTLILSEIRYRDAHKSFLPTNNEWWARDKEGNAVIGWEEGGYLLLDFSKPAFHQHIAKRAKAAVDSGVFDGIFLDWWIEDEQRIELIKEIRKTIGKDALILVNANDHKSPKTAEYINGHFMECYRTKTKEDWQRIENSLVWSEANLREPRINCLETWFKKSRQDLNLMRATTTLGLTLSDGYILFADPNPLPTPDHLHDWYPFWNADLGKPLSRGKKQENGSVIRSFEKGYAVYNPPGKTNTITFPTPHKRFSNGNINKIHRIAPLDGDIFFPVQKIPTKLK